MNCNPCRLKRVTGSAIKMLETWNVRVETLGYGHSQSALGEIDWKATLNSSKSGFCFLLKSVFRIIILPYCQGVLSFCELRLTMVMLGWLFGNVPDDLRSVLLALREYAEDEGQFVFSFCGSIGDKTR